MAKCKYCKGTLSKVGGPSPDKNLFRCHTCNRTIVAAVSELKHRTQDNEDALNGELYGKGHKQK